MKSVIWPLRCGVLQASQTQAIHPDAPCGSQPQQLSVLLVLCNETVRQIPDQVVLQTCRSQRWSPTTYTHGDCGSPKLEPTCKAVSSRVGGSIADCGGEMTGPVATNNP